jgi:hypothetical protein
MMMAPLAAMLLGAIRFLAGQPGTFHIPIFFIFG